MNVQLFHPGQPCHHQEEAEDRVQIRKGEVNIEIRNLTGGDNLIIVINNGPPVRVEARTAALWLVVGDEG